MQRAAINFMLGLLVFCQAAVAATVQAQAAPSQNQEVTMTLLHRKDGLNWLDLNLERNVPLFLLTVNDELVCGVIDTGSNRTALDLDLARSVGLEIGSLDASATALGEKLVVSLAKDAAVEVPGQFRLNMDVSAFKMPSYRCPNGLELKFVLGMDIIGVMTIVIDPIRNKVALVRGGRTTPPVSQWRKIEWSENTVDGQINSNSVKMLIDTGSWTPLLVRSSQFERLFEKEPLVPLDSSVTASGRQSDNVGVRQARYRVADLQATGDAKRIPDEGLRAPAHLGFAFFQKYGSIFDASRDAIYLQRLKSADD